MERRNTILECARATTYYHLPMSQVALHQLTYSRTRSHTTTYHFIFLLRGLIRLGSRSHLLGHQRAFLKH